MIDVGFDDALCLALPNVPAVSAEAATPAASAKCTRHAKPSEPDFSAFCLLPSPV